MKTTLQHASRNKLLEFILIVAFFLSYAQTNAATIVAAGDGNWNNTGTWVGGVIPGIGDSVVIADGNSITVASAAYARDITLVNNVFLATSKVSINSGITLTVAKKVHIESQDDIAIASMAISGTVIIQGDIEFSNTHSPSYANIDMRNTGSVMEIQGNIINPSGGSILNTGSKPSTIRFNGSAAQTVPIVSTITYFHLDMNNGHSSGATLGAAVSATRVLGNITVSGGTFSNGGFAIVGNSTNFTVSSGGNFLMAGTSGLPTSMTHVISSTGSITYGGGSQSIATPNNGQNYGNLVISGTGTKTLTANAIVTGNLTLSASTLDVDNTSNYSLSVAGNWINTGGTFQARAGTVTFNGSSAQGVTSNNNSFYDLTINNSSTGISLNDNLTVDNTLTLTDGVISTGSNRVYIDNSSAASVTGHSSASFVYGNLRRNIATNTSTYAFPVGNGTTGNRYFLAEIVNNNLSGISYIDGSFEPLTDHNDEDMSVSDAGEITYSSMNTSGVWVIEPNLAPSGGSYDIKAYVGNMYGPMDNKFGILKRSVASSSAADWSTGGGTINTAGGEGRLVSGGYALRMGLTSFSEFGMGTEGFGGYGLPISLISFTAKWQSKGYVDVNWTTVTEINNDYFTVERSKDGINFKGLINKDGAGSSAETHTYNFKDAAPFAGTSYYRLKQTDFDGGYTYSDIVTVKGMMDLSSTGVKISPNPVNAGSPVSISTGTDDETVEVFVLEPASGKTVYTGTLSNGDGGQFKMIAPELPAGLYLLQISGSEGGSAVKKLLIN